MILMKSLAVRRNIFDLKFLFRLVNGYIDCPELLSLIHFYVNDKLETLIHLKIDYTELTIYFFICTIK
ncbi:Uncharacterized protein FWK35_00000330 [Aphis craccivora]|uniref:Uncharacterized protein n=1 Tax=Aphis craccivora TaxID=307492 RepID=A0A6G0ZQY0_APHCR|nr:Uncharacterized protein FWK35_00000330 [Aphis craccivora]